MRFIWEGIYHYEKVLMDYLFSDDVYPQPINGCTHRRRRQW